MRRTSPRNSTTVRDIARLCAARIGFLLGGRVAPAWAVKRAGRLFSTPLSPRRRASVAGGDAEVREATLEVDGTRLHTYAWGDPATQPYILFAHGWSSDGGRIASWVPALRAAGYAVVSFDQAAHGRSDGERTTLPDFACHLMAVARRHGPAAAVVGHSLGATATALALARGLRARRAILISPLADPMVAVERFSRGVWLPGHLGRRMFAEFERAMRFEADELRAHANAPAIGCPALILHDLDDREVPWGEGECYARYWPAARLLSTRGLGHHRIVDDAGTIGAALRFLHGECVGERVVSSPNLRYGFA